MEKAARNILVVIGVLSVLFALLGIYYNLVSLSATYPEVLLRQRSGGPNNLAYFFRAFYTMSGLCLVSHSLLLICGLQLVRLRAWWVWPLTAVLILEIAFFLSVGLVWTSPFLGPSVRAATGVATGGLMPRFITLFSVWAPILGHWARRRVGRTGGDGNSKPATVLAAALLCSLLLLPYGARAQSCSTSADCPPGERCVGVNPTVVEDCFLFIFCDTYTVFQLECQPSEEDQGEEEDQQILRVCINDQFYMANLCRLAFLLLEWLFDI